MKAIRVLEAMAMVESGVPLSVEGVSVAGMWLTRWEALKEALRGEVNKEQREEAGLFERGGQEFDQRIMDQLAVAEGAIDRAIELGRAAGRWCPLHLGREYAAIVGEQGIAPGAGQVVGLGALKREVGKASERVRELSDWVAWE